MAYVDPTTSGPDAPMHALRLAVEELQSRREDDINDFAEDEPAVGRLVRALDALLNSHTHDAGGALSFLDTALQSYKPSPVVMQVLDRAKRRNLPSAEDTFRLWMLFALSTEGVLALTLRDVLAMHDLLMGFFVDSSPLLTTPNAPQQVARLVEGATQHPSVGAIRYRLDISSMTLFMPPAGYPPTAASAVSPSTPSEPSVGFGSDVVTTTKRRLTIAGGRRGGGPGSAARRRAQTTAQSGPPPQGGSTSSHPSQSPRAESGMPRRAPSSSAVDGDALDAPGSHTNFSASPDLASTLLPAGGGSSAAMDFVSVGIQVPLVPTSDGDAVPQDPTMRSLSASQTVVEQPVLPKMETESRDSQTTDPAPRVSYADLKRLERHVAERDRINRETSERLQRENEEVRELRDDVEEKLEQVTTMLRSIKALYNNHFMLVKESQDTARDIDRAAVDAKFPRLVAVLNDTHQPPPPDGGGGGGGGDRGSGSSGSAADDTRGTLGSQQPRGGGGSGEDWTTLSSPASLKDGKAGGGGTTFSPRAQAAAVAVANDIALRESMASFTQFSDAGSVGTRPAPSAAGGAPTDISRRESSVIGRQMSSALPAPQSVPPVSSSSLKRPWKTAIFEEVERFQQLEIQQYRCATCGKDLPNPNNTNLFTKAVQRTAKPRRCHYSGELHCHECHTNKRHMLPFLIVQQWNFTEEHVCNRDYEYLFQQSTRPMIQITELPPDVRSRNVVVQAGQLRELLGKLYEIMHGCPKARQQFGSQLGHYYFAHPRYYSLRDLLSFRNKEEAETRLTDRILGSAGHDVIATLEGLVKTGKAHCRQDCQRCIAQTVLQCTLCGDADPVVMYDDGVRCDDCGRPFHRHCLALGCSHCDTIAISAHRRS